MGNTRSHYCQSQGQDSVQAFEACALSRLASGCRQRGFDARQHACLVSGCSLAAAFRLCARRLSPLVPQAPKPCKLSCHAHRTCVPVRLAQAGACLMLQGCFWLKQGSSAAVCSWTACPCRLALLMFVCCSIHSSPASRFAVPVSSSPQPASTSSCLQSRLMLFSPASEVFSAPQAPLKRQGPPSLFCLRKPSLLAS